MSAASLATSVPVMPMATPMAACCSAGASLTPSPVMAGTSSSLASIFTNFCLSAGSVRQNSRLPVRSFSCCASSGSLKKSRPTKARSVTSSSAPKMLQSRAMAMAVSLESPVITITRMPARAHTLMASATSGRAGSLMPARPTNVRPCSMPAKCLGSFSSGCAAASAPPASRSRSASAPRSSASLTARARQRSGRVAISVFFSRICRR
mmetsp:Transcript_2365/g.3783  ORF Transcript_2365/g.3783 Transcript_2365/m.3783 type:complete len:208 (-) Transcript_2365:278-901(-)